MPKFGRFILVFTESGRIASITSEQTPLELKFCVATLTVGMWPVEIFVPIVKLHQFSASPLTNAAYDPSAKLPEYKACAVGVDKVEAGEGSPSTAGLQKGRGRAV